MYICKYIYIPALWGIILPTHLESVCSFSCSAYISLLLHLLEQQMMAQMHYGSCHRTPRRKSWRLVSALAMVAI